METEVVKGFAEYGALGLMVVFLATALVIVLKMYHNILLTIVGDLKKCIEVNTATLKAVSETCTRNSILLEQAPRRSTETRMREHVE